MRKPGFLALSKRMLAAICFIAVAGCWDHGITWLPDSSGFVYADFHARTQLRNFDLATRKVRVLVEDTKAPTYWPAVSPDGKQIAVARVLYAYDEKARSMQISRYDLNGKELSRSPALSWHINHSIGTRFGDGTKWVGTTSLFWSPQGDKIVVTDSVEGIPAGTAIYDIAKESLVPLKGHVLVIGTSPIRPDGKLFFLWNYDRIAQVSMDGKEERLPPGRLLDVEQRHVLRGGYGDNARWEGAVAVVTGATAELRIDTEKRSVVLKDGSPRKDSEGRLISAECVFPKGGAIVRALLDQGWDAGLEVRKPGDKQPHEVSKRGHYLFVPSPDRNWLALRGMSQGSKILVIDRHGEVVAELPQ